MSWAQKFKDEDQSYETKSMVNRGAPQAKHNSLAFLKQLEIT